MSSADQMVYSLSTSSDTTDRPFIKKETVYVMDSNNGVYTNSILIETSSISNSGKWWAMRDSVITIPYVVVAKAANDIADLVTSSFLTLKNGYHNLISSIQVEYNGTILHQQIPYSNIYWSYKMISSFSTDDVEKFGSLLHFYPDDYRSVGFSVAANYDGQGTLTNGFANPIARGSVANAAPEPYYRRSQNVGFLRRIYNCVQFGVADTFSALLSDASSISVSANRFYNNGVAADGRVFIWEFLATIRLCDISDFFDKAPMLKGAFIKLTLNFNSGQSVVTLSNAGPSTQTLTTYNQLAGTSNSIQLSSTNQGEGAYAGFSVANNVITQTKYNTVLTIVSGVASVSAFGSTFRHSAFTSCRLYADLYTLRPEYEAQYLQLNPTQTIVYRDLYQYTIPNVASGASFNALLTNGIARMKELVVCGFFSAGANNASSVGQSALQLCWGSEPSSPSPLTAITNYQVTVAGLNLYPSQQLYDFETFINEIQYNGINGGKTTGLCSGQIHRDAWRNLYRYYVSDLSRGNPSDDNVPKSIQITGKNVCAKIIDYYCFIAYERTLAVNTLTGQVISAV